MKYMGSKNRHSKEIVPILIKDRKMGQFFVEPMVGGANIIDKITGNRIGGDNNYYLSCMWKAVSIGWMPPLDFSENQYNDIRKNKEMYAPELVGYVGFALSYGGKFFGGWRRDGLGKRNYVKEAYQNAKKTIS